MFPIQQLKNKTPLSWSSADPHAPLPVRAENGQAPIILSDVNSYFETREHHISLRLGEVRRSTLEAPLALQGNSQAQMFQHDKWNEKVNHFFQVGLWIGSWEAGEREREVNENSALQVDLPLYQSVVRRGSKSTQASRSTQRLEDSHRTTDTHQTQDVHRTQVIQHNRRMRIGAAGADRRHQSHVLPLLVIHCTHETEPSLVGVRAQDQ